MSSLHIKINPDLTEEPERLAYAWKRATLVAKRLGVKISKTNIIINDLSYQKKDRDIQPPVYDGVHVSISIFNIPEEFENKKFKDNADDVVEKAFPNVKVMESPERPIYDKYYSDEEYKGKDYSL